MLPLNHRGSPSGVYPHNLQLLFDLIFAAEDKDVAGADEGGEFAAVEGSRTELVSAGVGSGGGFKVLASVERIRLAEVERVWRHCVEEFIEFVQLIVH
ncbi:hypothetical protein HG530_015433 [Fusarium avenaceum]|nr:hypothetical protein HG530_015433 [Fusarium avenaceum]